MIQSENDLRQLKACRKDLANVYKTQVTDDIIDNGNLSEIHNAILNLQNVIRWLENKLKEKK